MVCPRSHSRGGSISVSLVGCVVHSTPQGLCTGRTLSTVPLAEATGWALGRRGRTMQPRQVGPAFGVCLVLKGLRYDRRPGEDGCLHLCVLSSLSWRSCGLKMPTQRRPWLLTPTGSLTQITHVLCGLGIYNTCSTDEGMNSGGMEKPA